MDEIIALIGEAAAIRLAENFAGTRLYVPGRVKEGSRLASAIGYHAAKKLSARFSPDVICVPMARYLRAAHYRGQGLSNARIAVRLGITESGVEKIVRAMKDAGQLE